MTDDGSLGSHPHSDRPNWQPAETLDDYARNCREGLEDDSDRRAAQLLGRSRMAVYRAKLMAGLPTSFSNGSWMRVWTAPKRSQM